MGDYNDVHYIQPLETIGILPKKGKLGLTEQAEKEIFGLVSKFK